jgi:hypothetical protein
MGNNLFTTIDNYEIYTNVTDDDAVFLKKESFKIALKCLVDGLNKYTDTNAKKMVHTLVENTMDNIKKNRYVYFDISGATVGEKDPHMYVIKFAWEPFCRIHITDIRNALVSSIGSYIGCVRWESEDFHYMFSVEFNDDITYGAWKDCICISHRGAYFYDLNEYLFNGFMTRFYSYRDSLAYLGYNPKEGVDTGAQKVADIFSNAAALLSEYPKGIDYNDSKKCSTVDWFYNTLDLVFNELHEKNSLDGACFYMAMRDYVKEIENVINLSTAAIKEE